MRIRLFILFIIFTVCALPQQGFSVVVHKDNPVKSISKALLRKMILGELSTWPGGAKVSVLMGPVGDGARTSALQQICGMGESDFSKHALQVSFDGGSKSMPKTLPSTTIVRSVVALTPSGLGIVDGTDAGPGLRILTIE